MGQNRKIVHGYCVGTYTPWDANYPYGYNDEPKHLADPDYHLQTSFERIKEMIIRYPYFGGYDEKLSFDELTHVYVDMLHPVLYQNFDECFRHESLSQIIVFPHKNEYGEFTGDTLQDLFGRGGFPKDDDIMLLEFYDYSNRIRNPDYFPYIPYEDPIAPLLKQLDEMDAMQRKELCNKILKAITRRN